MTRTRNQTVLLLALGLAALPVSVAAAEEPITGSYAHRVMIFEVQSPDAASSNAIRTLPAHPKLGGELMVERWEMSSSVFVKSESVSAVTKALLETVDPRVGPNGAALATGLPAGVSVERFDPAPGWVIVRAPSVRAAAEISMDLRGTELFDSVDVSAMPAKVLRGGPVGDLLAQQWHLNNYINPIADVNAQAAWDRGYTGLGINIGIIEGTFQFDDPIDLRDVPHPDLEANINYSLMTPTLTSQQNHATSVAGIIAARGDNTDGGAGIAYNANIASQIYGNLETTITALTWKIGQTDIKNNSWGLEDAGRLVYLTDVLADALELAGTNGRGAKRGTIVTWAGGNGGTNGNDRADYDPWVTNRFVLGFGAIGDDDKAAWYTERGSNIFMVTHSDGGQRGIITTDITGTDGYSQGSYTAGFGGTSAAAPLASGAIALAFEANPEMTRRDLMHVMVNSARKNDPTDTEWTQNGAGFWINDMYGHGAIDAGALVLAAETHEMVRPESVLTTGPLTVNMPIPDNDPTGIQYDFEMSPGLTIESIEFVVNLTSTFVGDIEIVLTSPSGTSSKLMHTRSDPNQGIFGYPFKSYRHWGEDSGGVWSVHVADKGVADLATLNVVELKAFGTVCAADLNFDSVLDQGDIGLFVESFLAQDGIADFNSDGFIDSGDIVAFVEQFLAGCD